MMQTKLDSFMGLMDLLGLVKSDAKDLDSFPILELAAKSFTNFYLYSRLVQTQRLSSLDAQSQAWLSDLYAENFKRNESALRELSNIHDYFDSHSIGFIPIKGASILLQNVYQDLGARFMTDLDLVVEPSKAEDAFSVLQENGYERIDEGRGEQFYEGDWHQFPRLKHPDSSLFIEVHESPLSIYCEGLLTSTSLFENAIEIKVQGRLFKVPCDDHALLICFAHSMVTDNHFGSYTFSIRQLIDAYELLSVTDVDVHRVEALFHKSGFDKQFRSYCFFLDKLFKLELGLRYSKVDMRYAEKALDLLALNEEVYIKTARRYWFAALIKRSFSKAELFRRYKVSNKLFLPWLYIAEALRLSFKGVMPSFWIWHLRHHKKINDSL